MKSTFKRIIYIVPVIGGFYLLIPSLFWPEPAVTAPIPDTVSIHKDLEIPIAVEAWHRVRVFRVTLYVDKDASTAKGRKGLPDPEQVFESRAGMIDRIDVVTHPWRESLTVTVPLRDFAQKKQLGRGVLTGRLDVDLRYYTPPCRGCDEQENMTRSFPFKTTVVD